MTVTTARPVAPGDTIHFLETGMTLDAGEPGLLNPRPVEVPRGTTITLTANMIANSRDRLGVSFLDLVDDEAAQEDRWKKVMFRRGPWPEREQVLRKGSVEALIERDRRRAKLTRHYEGDDLADLLRVPRPEPRQWQTLQELDQVADGLFRRADAERLAGYWGSLEEFEAWLNLHGGTDPYTEPTPDQEV